MNATTPSPPARSARERAAGPRPAPGFTLVELVVALVAAAILAALAVNSYRSYTLQARRATAVTALTDAASRQEQFFLNNRTYTQSLAADGLNMDALTEGGHYAVSVDTATVACPIGRCWSMRAIPQGIQTEDACGTLTYNSDGDRTPAGCW